MSFRTRELEQCFENLDIGIRRWGISVAQAYVTRIEMLGAARNLQEIRNVRSMRFHALRGNRAGQYAINLNGNWRLIVRIGDTANSMVVLEVTNHHGD